MNKLSNKDLPEKRQCPKRGTRPWWGSWLVLVGTVGVVGRTRLQVLLPVEAEAPVLPTTLRALSHMNPKQLAFPGAFCDEYTVCRDK